MMLESIVQQIVVYVCHMQNTSIFRKNEKYFVYYNLMVVGTRAHNAFV